MKKIFYSTDINLGWDGTYNGKPVPQGSYTVAIEFTSSTNKQKFYIVNNITVIK
jgi:flagellar hook assembly protein FlgD